MNCLQLKSSSLLLLTVLLLGCSTPHQMTGVVHRRRFVQDHYELSLGAANSSDYVVVDMPVIFGLQGPVSIQRGSPAERSLADKYVGKTLRASGEIQRDAVRRRFI